MIAVRDKEDIITTKNQVYGVAATDQKNLKADTDDIYVNEESTYETVNPYAL